ncbi:MAG: peptidoglycan DD-metalloendopeptidase family protein [Alphaproteobacteria bacterium]|nr:peptidoglycan DD-metalloendopeptidase family protein [Alphaproteobacteria bacterium]
MKKTACVLATVLLYTGMVFAAPTTTDLKRIEQQLKAERQAGLEAQKKANELSNEMKAVQRQIIGSAKNVQAKEEVLSTLEEKLTALNTKEQELNQKISLTDAQMAQVVMGMQRLALRPKESLFFKPMSPIETVRSQSLMVTSIPVLGNLNAEARSDLTELIQTRSQITSQAQQVKSAAQELAEKQARMERLLKQKQTLQAQYQATHEQATKRAQALAGQANDLKDLLKKLEEEKRRQQLERERKENARLAALERERKLSAAQGKKVSASTQRAHPTNIAKGAFKKSYGSLLWPAKGKIIQNFGDTTVSGAHLKGMIISTRSNAQVISPFDGSVLFSGPFKNYGHLLIIDNGDNYLTLLAGMEKIYVNVGQDLLAGEPVGQTKYQNPTLYIEIRKDGTAINPRPWFSRM